MTENPSVRGSETTRHTRYDWQGQSTEEQIRNRDNPGGPPAGPADRRGPGG